MARIFVHGIAALSLVLVFATSSNAQVTGVISDVSQYVNEYAGNEFEEPGDLLKVSTVAGVTNPFGVAKLCVLEITWDTGASASTDFLVPAGGTAIASLISSINAPPQHVVAGDVLLTHLGNNLDEEHFSFTWVELGGGTGL